MKKWLLVMLASLMLLVSCSKGKNETVDNKLSGSLKIAGGTAHLKVMKNVADVLKAANPDLNISISGGGSGVGIKSVGEGMVDIGNSGRALKDTEIEKYGLVPHKIAIDGIAVVVNSGSVTENLNFDQIANIFSGKISNWKELGGKDEKINIYSRDSKSGTRKTFVKLALSNGNISKDAIIVNSNGNMKQAIANDKNGIGYMSVGYLDESVKGVSVENVKPTLANVKAGAYKIQRYLYSVTKGQPTGAAKEFIDLLLNAEGQKIVSKFHFIPVK